MKSVIVTFVKLQYMRIGMLRNEETACSDIKHNNRYGVKLILDDY